MPKTSANPAHGGLPPVEDDFPFGGDGAGEPDPSRGNQRRASLTGIIVAMFASVMTFAALVSALVVRRSIGREWLHFEIPSILWTNTALLIASSIALDMARRMLRKRRRKAFNWFWTMGTLLGTGFLAGQVVAWNGLHARGLYLAANASSSFFYILTWTHAAHAIIGLAALATYDVKALRYRLGPSSRTGVLVSSVFWHFLDGMWLLLMCVFVFLS